LPQQIVHDHLEEVYIKIKQAKQRVPGSNTAKGGTICLIPTYKPIEEWKPEAIRELPNMEWSWGT